ncbi:MAG: prkC 18, partial [Gemmataceae bacterium]|nr:prkC 18 [Gemmataceae bacterium]
AWAIARQAAAGLAHAAAHGVVHRDVKPANLFLVPTSAGLGLPRDVPLVKVMDFGLALTRWAGDGPDGHLTAPGVVLGTPVYMAPEQYRQATEVDHRADIYALGATMFHALAGRPPFAGRTVWGVMEQKMKHTPRLGPPVSRESAELVGAMMAADPADRVGTYEDLIDRIDQLPVMLRPDSVLTAAGRAARRRWRLRRWALAGAATGAVAVVATGVCLGRGLWPGRQSTGPGSESLPPPPGPARYVPGGDPDLLFDGKSLGQWLPRARGVWQIDTDDDGSKALSGAGFTRRAFSPFEDYQVTLGLDIHKADAAEVHFAVAPAGPRLVLRISKGGAVFGTREGHEEPFRPREEGQLVPFPSAAWLADHGRYLEVKFGRAGGRWTVWFNGKKAGQVDDDRPKGAEFWLFAEGGPVRVTDVWLTRLEKK